MLGPDEHHVGAALVGVPPPLGLPPPGARPPGLGVTLPPRFCTTDWIRALSVSAILATAPRFLFVRGFPDFGADISTSIPFDVFAFIARFALLDF